MFSAIVNRVFIHWKTSTAGMLAVAGIVFGAISSNYGPAKWVLTGIAIVSGLTALLAQDPGLPSSPVSSSTGTSSTSKLGAVALCVLLISVSVTGCTAATVQKAVTLINSELPAIESAEAAVSVFVSALDPAIAPIIAIGNPIIQAGLKQLSVLCTNYLANPNTSLWAQITSLVDSIVTQGDQALLAAAHISDPSSQQKATTILSALDGLLHIIDSYVSSAQPASTVAATANARAAKLKTISQLWTPATRDSMNAALVSHVDLNYGQWLQLEQSHGF
jgi:hypothetical protein